jgi:predicted metal-binding protein
VGELLGTIEYDYPDFHLSMDCFQAVVSEGELVLHVHEAAKWLTREELDSVDWLPADITLIDTIKEKWEKGILMAHEFFGDTQLYEIAADVGFDGTAVITTKQLQFVPAFRALCEKNDCGNYGKNYACPPSCGTPEEMKQKVLSYRKAIVFQSEFTVADAMDPALTKPMKESHIQKTRQAIEKMKEAGMKMDGFAVMCGPCNFCAVCAQVEGRPCPHPEKRASCLSAYCINATELATSCGMKLDWSGNQATFLSMYVYDAKA